MSIYMMFALTGLVVTLLLGGVALLRNRADKTVLYKPLSVIGGVIEKYYIIFLLLIIAVFLVSRILKLEVFPHGLHVDEIAVAVDVKSILLNGVDRNGIHYPAYFYDYGNGQNALYVYVEAFLLKFLPATVFTLRIQAVIWGLAGLLAIFGICYEISENKGWALVGAALATILPMYIMSERWALEAYLFLPTANITMYFIIRALKHGKIRDYILAGVFMGTSLYTYAVSYMVWPIFLVLSAAYLIYLKKVSFKQLLAFGIPLGILAFPLILFQLVNFRIIEPFTLGITDYIPLPYSRGEEMSLANIPGNFAYIKKLFLGGEALTYNSFKEFGTIYMFLLPFVLAGFIIAIVETVSSVRKKEFSPLPIILFFWFGGTVFLFVVEYANVNRVNELFCPFLLFIFVAIYRLLKRNQVTLVWLAVWSAASFVFFMYFYFFVQNSVYGYHELHTSTTPGRAIVKARTYYMKDENTHIYMQYEDQAIHPCEQVYYFAAVPGDVYESGCSDYGRVSGHLPEEIDINENAVYIISNNWPHIISYLISEGFLADQSYPDYSILFRLN